MPLIQSGTGAALKKNFHELRRGKVFATTQEKYGKKVADKQMAAIALKNQRKNSNLKGSSGIKT
jgi:hypothetical protein